MNRGLLIFSLLVATPVFAWEPQTGDIIFQVSRSSQSKAIAASNRIALYDDGAGCSNPEFCCTFTE